MVEDRAAHIFSQAQVTSHHGGSPFRWIPSLPTLDFRDGLQEAQGLQRAGGSNPRIEQYDFNLSQRGI
jgi:hypothetical protein